MKTIYVCSNCGSNEIQAKAWVELNRVEIIDWSISEQGEAEDFWCPSCETHSKSELVTVYEKEDRVYWTDPEGISSGKYTVMETQDNSSDTISLINSTTELEALTSEVTLLL